MRSFFAVVGDLLKLLEGVGKLELDRRPRRYCRRETALHLGTECTDYGLTELMRGFESLDAFVYWRPGVGDVLDWKINVQSSKEVFSELQSTQNS